MSALTLTRVTQTHDEATGQVTPTRVTISVSSFAVDAHELFRAFGLIKANQVGIQISTAPGVDRPRAGDTFPWGTELGNPVTYTVKDVRPFSLNGIDTLASLVLGEK